jgi:hypothetical protein
MLQESPQIGLLEVKGQYHVRRAVEVAAAGWSGQNCGRGTRRRHGDPAREIANLIGHHYTGVRLRQIGEAIGEADLSKDQ